MSILEYTGEAAASAVIMSHQLRSQKILFVEAVSDGRMLGTLLDNKVILISAKGVEGVTKALDTIEQNNSQKKGKTIIDAKGFIDRDYLDLHDDKCLLSRSDMITTKYRDIEIDLFHTPSMKRLLEEKGSSKKWTDEKEVVDKVLKSLYQFSLLRAYNALHNKSWSFTCINLDKYVDTSGIINETKLFSAFRQNNSLSKKDWELFEKWQSMEKLCPKSITRGHDATCVLGQMLRKSIGNRKKAESTYDIIEENLRLAVQRSYIEVFNWFKLLLKWTSTNLAPA